MKKLNANLKLYSHSHNQVIYFHIENSACVNIFYYIFVLTGIFSEVQNKRKDVLMFTSVIYIWGKAATKESNKQ